MSFSNLGGWINDPVATKQYASKVGSLQSYGLYCGEQRDVFLWKPLLKCKPTWKRGAQGIGDCVSWGAELCATMLLAIQAELGTSEWVEEAATEPLYGLGRVEIPGRGNGGFSDGAVGAWVADALHKYGILLRLDYSTQTGNKEHDLRVYSSDKAKQWGNYGCGGRNDKGALDAIARKYPVKNVAQIQNMEQCISAISNGYPVSIASSAGFGQMKRDQSGIVRRSGTWQHQMMIGGIKWVNGKPLSRIFQSWGNTCGTSNDPGIEDMEISKCSWWATEEDVSWILRSGDCWSYADAEGFPPRKLDFLEAFKTWG